MPANTAAGASETGANESGTQPTLENGSSPENVPAPEQQAHGAPIGARLGALLDSMGELPDDAVIEGEDHEEEGQPQAPAPASNRQPRASESKPGDGEELTEEQRRNTDPKLLARIDKLTARLRTAERDAAEARKAPSQSSPAPTAQAPAFDPQDPTAHIETIDQLQQFYRDTEALNAWAVLNQDGATDVVVGKDKNGEDIVRDFTAQEARKIQLDTDRLLRRGIPQRAATMQAQANVEQQRTQFDEHARAEYPSLFDEESDDHRLALKLLDAVPALKAFPDAMLQAGIFIEGLKAFSQRQEAKKGNGQPSGNGSGKGKDALAAFTRRQPTRAPQMPRVERPSTNGSRAESADSKIREAAATAAGDGDTEDLVGAILEGRQQRGAPRGTAN